MAYVLLHALRTQGLAGTRLARAQCNTLRLRLLKVAAHIRVTTRHIWIALTAYLPDADLFAVAANRLHQARAPA